MPELTNPNTLKILQKIRSLIEAGWTQNRYAETSTGRTISPHEENACKFCLAGALIAADAQFAKDRNGDAVQYLKRAIYKDYGIVGVVQFNDSAFRTKKQVLGILDSAIKACSDKLKLTTD